MCANGVLGRLVIRFLVNVTELFDLNSSSTHIGTVEVPHTLPGTTSLVLLSILGRILVRNPY